MTGRWVLLFFAAGCAVDRTGLGPWSDGGSGSGGGPGGGGGPAGGQGGGALGPGRDGAAGGPSGDAGADLPLPPPDSLPEGGVPGCPMLVSGLGDPAGDGDGDGVINQRDSCPYDSNREQVDVDRDHLGDVCDPFREVPNCVLLQDEFMPQAKPEWMSDSGDWHSDGRVLAQRDTVVNGSDIWLGPGLSAADFFIETRVFRDAVGNPSRASTTDLLFRVKAVQGSNNRFYSCGIDWEMRRLELARFDGTGATAVIAVADSGALGSRFVRLRAFAVGQRLGCEIVETKSRISGTDAAYAIGSAGLRTFNAAAAFDYFRIFGIPTGTPLPF